MSNAPITPSDPTGPDRHDLSAHTVIVGFGLPGRAAAEALDKQSLSYCVIELNRETVERCARGGVPIIVGDATQEQVLRRACIDRATSIIIAVPDQQVALEITRLARGLNPSARIITRCHYLSAGLEARGAGASEVVVEELVVAAEIARLLAPRPASAG